MDCPPKKMVVVERWPLVGVRLYLTNAIKWDALLVLISLISESIRKWEFPSSRLNMEQKKQKVLVLKKAWFRPELNWRPSACKADVITTTLRNHSLPC